MPNPSTSGLHQTAILWTPSGIGDNGEPTYTTTTPAEIRVRWEDRYRVVDDPNGTPIALEADILVDRTIPADSLFWLGTLADWAESGLNDFGEVDGLMRAITFDSVPNIKGFNTSRSVGVARYKGTVPGGL